MTSTSTESTQELRRRAEEKFLSSGGPTSEIFSPEDKERLFHELQVHQIELEMQNEELRHSQSELESLQSSYFDLYDLAPVGYLTVSDEGYILKTNLTAATMLGMERNYSFHKPMTQFIFPEDQDLYYLYRKQLIDSGELQNLEMRLKRVDVSHFWAELQSTLAHNGENWITISDVTKRKRANIELAFQNEEKGKRADELAIANTELAFQNEEKGKRVAELVIANTELAFQNEEKGKRAAELVIANTELAFQNEEKDKRADELVISEARFSGAFVYSPIGMALVSTEGKWLKANVSLCKMLGYSEEQLLAKTFQDITHPDDLETDLNYVSQLLAGEIETYRMEKRYFHKQGQIIWILLSASLVRDSDDLPLYFIAQIENITERKQAEEALKESQKRLAGIIEGTRAGTWEWNVQTGETVFNEQWAEIIGYTLDEIAPVSIETWMKYAHPDDLLKCGELLEKHFRGESGYYEFESRMKHKDGQWIWVLDRGKVATWSDDGKPLWMCGTHQDITTRKQVEEVLWNERVFLRNLIDSAEDLIYFKDQNGLYLCCNKASERFIGLSESDQIGKSDFDLFGLELAEKIVRHDKEVMEGGRPNRSEDRVTLQDGVPFLMDTVKTPIYGSDNQLIGLVGISRDITQRKKTECELRNSEERYREIVESQSEFVDRFLPGGILTFVNSAVTRWVGISAGELIGTSFYPYIHKDDIGEVAGKIEALTPEVSQCTFEYRNAAPDGSLHWHQCTVHALTDERGQIIEYQGVGLDITEKKEAELFLAHAKETLELEVLARTAALEHAYKELQKISFELVWAEEKERERIAGELHDQVGQSLLLAKIKLDELAHELSSDELRTSAEKTAELIGTSIQDIRTLTFKMRPPLLDSPDIEKNLQYLCASINEDYNVAINFTGTDTSVTLACELRATLYRVARELLLNVIKHAKTTRAVLSLQTDGRNLTLCVIDQGVGFSYFGAVNKHHATVRGYGLLSVGQRIERIGGTLAVESALDRGTVVTVVVPLQQSYDDREDA